MAQTELSLFDLYNQLLQQQTKYGEKLDRIYDIFSGTMKFPDGVSNSNDSLGLWPDTGVNVYAILSEYNLAEQFCTIGILFNIGSGRYKYQIMVVQEDELHPIKNGKIYYRYSKQSSNTWSEWKRNVYLYELTGGKDSDGNKIKDDNGKDMTDTEDEDPDTNPHNKGTDSSKTTFVTEKSHQAERLSKHRKIELTDLISGLVMFDGSGDIHIETTSKNVVPINVHVPADHPSYDTYRLLCTLPASSLTMYDYVLITGHIGGWTTIDGKAYVTICASNREGFVINGISMGQAKDVDIVAYQLTNGEVKIYLKVNKNGWVDDSNLSVYGNDQIKISGDAEALDSTSVQIWSLKEKGILFDGKNITADLIGNAKTSILAQQSDSSMVVCNDNNRGYITATSQYGKYNQLFCNSGVMLDRVTGSVVANTFKGNLVGNADTSTESAYATSIKANFNVTTKGYLLAIVGDNKYTPFYDTGIYLTTNSGQMHINNLEADYIKANNIVTYVSPVCTIFTYNNRISFIHKVRLHTFKLRLNPTFFAPCRIITGSMIITTPVQYRAVFTTTEIPWFIIMYFAHHSACYDISRH